jgi:large subunit ribosomal protein L10
MAKSKEQKKEMLNNIEKNISRAKSVIFARFNNLGVSENNKLRGKLKKENSEYLVTKKTLLNLAMKNSKVKDFDAKKFDGQIATVFGYEDEVAPAKIIGEFMKENDEKIEFLGGVLENKLMNAEEVTQLAKLPSKDELYAKVVGSLNAPVSGFVNALAGNLRNLVNVLNNIKDQKA